MAAEVKIRRPRLRGAVSKVLFNGLQVLKTLELRLE